MLQRGAARRPYGAGDVLFIVAPGAEALRVEFDEAEEIEPSPTWTI